MLNINGKAELLSAGRGTGVICGHQEACKYELVDMCSYCGVPCLHCFELLCCADGPLIIYYGRLDQPVALALSVRPELAI